METVMDTALLLRIATEKKEKLSNQMIEDYLAESQIVAKLTADFQEKDFFVLFRLIGLAEIPYAQQIPYTQKLLAYADTHFVTAEGFSYTGKVKDIVPCYNAMLLEAYTRCGLADSAAVQNALNWIKQYQIFRRNEKTSWQYDGICKHGGCLKKTPCYIGIGKTVRALITYAEFTDRQDSDVETLIHDGIQYMLQHQMYQRLSNGQPISAHITDNMFPQSYALSLTDLVYIAGKRIPNDHKNLVPLFELLHSKEVTENRWKIDYIYQHKGYKAFSTKRKSSDWLSELYPLWLAE